MFNWAELNVLEMTGIGTILFLALLGIGTILYYIWKYMSYKELDEPFDPSWMDYESYKELTPKTKRRY